MKWLLGFVLLFSLALAVLFVPVQGRTLWSRGAAREMAQFVAHGLRAGWDAIASIREEHPHPTRRIPPPPRQAAQRVAEARKHAQEAAAEARKSREGIVAQPPKEKLQPDDRAALDKLLSASR